LTSLNLACNAIGGHKDSFASPFIATPEGIVALSPLYPGTYPHAPFLISLLTSGPAAIADAIKGMRALLQLNIADNSINNGGRGMDRIGPAIAASTSITSLNIASNFVGMNGGVVQVVQVLRDNAALTSLDISGNMLVGQKGTGRYKSESVEVGYMEWEDRDVEIMEPDYRGIEALAHGISGNGALTSLNLASNRLRVEGAKIIAAFLPKCT
jgi:hypothetical protein